MLTIISIKRTGNLIVNSFYNEIPNDPTELKRKKVNNAIKELKSARLLDEKTVTKLESQEVKTPAFNTFPKTSKPKKPGRPVTSSVNCHSTIISQYANHYLLPQRQRINLTLKTQLTSSKKYII